MKKGMIKGGMKPRLSTSFGAFAKRGDEWVTRREQERDYGRNLETENPERDWWNLYIGDTKATAAQIANLRLFGGDADEIKRDPHSRYLNDDGRKRASICQQMHREMRQAEVVVVKPREFKAPAKTAADRPLNRRYRTDELRPRETLRLKLGGEDA